MTKTMGGHHPQNKIKLIMKIVNPCTFCVYAKENPGGFLVHRSIRWRAAEMGRNQGGPETIA